MFQVADVEVKPKVSPQSTNASFALSMKSQESFRLARQYKDKGETFVSIVTMPQTVIEDYDVIYMSQYESLFVGRERKIWNPFSRSENNEAEEVVIEYPKNVTLKSVLVENLFDDSTLLNVSCFSDADPQEKFRLIVADVPVKRNGVVNINARL